MSVGDVQAFLGITQRSITFTDLTSDSVAYFQVENLAGILFSSSPTSFPAQLITAYVQKCWFKNVHFSLLSLTGCNHYYTPHSKKEPVFVSLITKIFFCFLYSIKVLYFKHIKCLS